MKRVRSASGDMSTGVSSDGRAGPISAGETLTEMIRRAIWRKHERKVRRLDLLMMWCACLSICLMLISMQMPSSTARLVLDSCISLLCVLLVAMVARYHRLLTRRRFIVAARAKAADDAGKHGVAALQRGAGVLLEFLVMLVHVPPYREETGVPNEIAMLMFLRLYVVLRVARDYEEQRRMLSANSRPGSRMLMADAVKSLYYTRPILSVACSSMLLTFVIAYGIMLAEADSESAISPHTYGESLWLMAVTMTTVGYGDFVPSSFSARLLALLGAFAGIILTAITISIVHSHLALSYQQAYAVKCMIRDRLQERLEHCAASLIAVQLQLVYHTRRLHEEVQSNDNSPSSRQRTCAVRLRTLTQPRANGHSRRASFQDDGDPAKAAAAAASTPVEKFDPEATKTNGTEEGAAAAAEPPSSLAEVIRAANQQQNGGQLFGPMRSNGRDASNEEGGDGEGGESEAGTPPLPYPRKRRTSWSGSSSTSQLAVDFARALQKGGQIGRIKSVKRDSTRSSRTGSSRVEASNRAGTERVIRELQARSQTLRLELRVWLDKRAAANPDASDPQMHLLFGLGTRMRDVQGMLLQLLSDMQRMRRSGSFATGDGGDVRRLEHHLQDFEQSVDRRLERIEAALKDLTAIVGAKPQHQADEAVKSV